MPTRTTRKERIRGAWDLRKLAFRYVPEYRFRVVEAFGGLALAIIGYAGGLDNAIDVVLFLVGMASAFHGFVKAVQELVDLRPNTSKERVEVVQAETIFKYGREANFSDLAPSAEESALGFDTVATPEGAALVSDQFDDRLMYAPRVPFVESPGHRNFVAADREARRAQLAYLYYKTNEGKRGTNDTKVIILSPLAKMFDGLEVAKAGYFESMMTQEAFASRVYSVPIVDGEDRRVITDGTEWFPVELHGEALTLKPLPVIGVTSHFGCGAIVLDAKNRILWARQSAHNMQSAGRIVSRASGSMDYADLGSYPRSPDFRDAVKRNIAREAYEEMGLGRDPRPEAKLKQILVQNTLVTGLARSVERSGKPDFLGIIRLPPDIALVGVDDYELEIVNKLPFVIEPIRKLEDFRSALAVIERSEAKMAATTWLALRRLAVIAGYKNSDDARRRTIAAKFEAFLKLEETT